MIKVLKTGQGPAGPPGSGGGGGGSQPVQVNQSVASVNWVVNHNLGYRPQVQVFTSGGLKIFTEVLHTTVNQYQINFVLPTAGYSIYQ